MSVNVADMTTKPKRGRPAGLLINPDAARHVLGDRPQSWWATQAGMSTAHLSEIIKGTKGAAPEVAQRLADAVGVSAGVIFPELVQFSTQVRHFVAPRIGEVA